MMVKLKPMAKEMMVRAKMGRGLLCWALSPLAIGKGVPGFETAWAEVATSVLVLAKRFFLFTLAQEVGSR